MAIALLGIISLGCGSSDTGDAELGKKGAESTVKSPDQLPADMDPAMKAQAEAAMKQRAAQSAVEQSEQAGRLKAAQASQGR